MLSNIPERRIFVFWTGNNEMSPARKAVLQSIRENSRVQVVLVTPRNLKEYLVEGYPLHEAYDYLSYTHRADYLRCYFMHHHGGGYSDIKRINADWNPYFAKIDSDNNIWAIGYMEVGPEGVAAPPGMVDELRREWSKLIGQCAYIFKPNTPLTLAWYTKLHQELDRNLHTLKIHPAKHPQDKYKKKPENPLLRISGLYRSKYPFRWAQILGEISHPLFLKYTHKICNELPPPDFDIPYR
uniref:Capsular polysaccharide synthesis protein n=1 Tax=Candidatus Kentrum sp. LPFa TaxID=2126335 RepID=A0A450W1Z7_9GAMM|nr:MAG: Capsular polysaccharide synthesis protein [Candidatus Kentron sp. LPFa]VFK27411.1 MAG: Capsular polysaccharide synthesis protein [Candidatus Kentron sp. LPFa]